jgi:hypothetical protein
MILSRYILKEHIAPFFYALFVITFLFLVDFLIRILSSILSKGLARGPGNPDAQPGLDAGAVDPHGGAGGHPDGVRALLVG